jgi:hypothetical protein
MRICYLFDRHTEHLHGVPRRIVPDTNIIVLIEIEMPSSSSLHPFEESGADFTRDCELYVMVISVCLICISHIRSLYHVC